MVWIVGIVRMFLLSDKKMAFTYLEISIHYLQFDESIRCIYIYMHHMPNLGGTVRNRMSNLGGTIQNRMPHIGAAIWNYCLSKCSQESPLIFQPIEPNEDKFRHELLSGCIWLRPMAA